MGRQRDRQIYDEVNGVRHCPEVGIGVFTHFFPNSLNFSVYLKFFIVKCWGEVERKNGRILVMQPINIC